MLSSESRKLEHSLDNVDLESNKEKQFPTNKPTILIANDNIFLLNAFEYQFSQQFNVFKAENGLEAYKIAASKPIYFFDAILLDIQMPIMDGF
jgi:CheY-like chemotaxis protein